MNLSELAKIAHSNAEKKGFWTVTPSRFCEEIGILMAYLMALVELDRNGGKVEDLQDGLKMVRSKVHGLMEMTPHIVKEKAGNALAGRTVLVGTEVAELFEACKKFDMEGIEEEAADVLIRIGDLLGKIGKEDSVEKIVKKKQERNAERPKLHAKRY